MLQSSKNRLAQHLVLFFIFCCISGCIAVGLGKDLNWDLANYHLYNGYAFLYDREKLDVWPSEFIHVYFSPVFDIITYLFITYLPSIETVFLMGAIHGTNIYLLYLINCQLFKAHEYKKYLAPGLAFLGLLSPNILAGLGAFMHDNLVSIFVLAYVFLQLRFWQAYQENKVNWCLHFIGSFILGLGVGGKLTGLVFVVGGGFTYLVLFIKKEHKLTIVLSYLLAVCAGAMLLSGFWYWHLWKKYHNPIYPFFNKLFHSNYFSNTNWYDGRFFPKTVTQIIFFPFYFAASDIVKTPDEVTLSNQFIGYGYPIFYVLLLISLIKFFFTRVTNYALPTIWLLLFCLFSYLTWEYEFSISRYLVPMEWLLPTLIYLLLTYLFVHPPQQAAVAYVIFIIILSTFEVPTAVPPRARWYRGDYLQVDLPSWLNQKLTATVLVPISAYAMTSDPIPITYLIPFFPKQYHFVGIPFSGHHYIKTNYSNNIATRHKENLFILGSEDFQIPLANLFKRTIGSCSKINSDLEGARFGKILLCSLK